MDDNEVQGAVEFDRIGFIGLGVMGLPESTNLVHKSGRPVTVFDYAQERVAEAVREGAFAADSAAQVARTCDVILLSLPGRAEVEAVVRGPDGLLEHLGPGQVIVDLSTSPVDLVQELAEQLAERDVLFVDAPVARTRQAAVDGTLTIMVGAPSAAVFDRIRPLLECMASEVTHCGPSGAGALVKVLNNTVVFETVVALSEAVNVARRSGLVDAETLFQVFSSGSAASFALAHHGMQAILPDTHGTGVFSSRYMLKDISYALSAARLLHLDLPAATLASMLLEETIDAGYGDCYHTAVVRTLDKKGR